MTDAKAALRREMQALGVAAHEVSWLIDEFAPGGHDDTSALFAAARRRVDGEPLQYIVGHWPFRELELDVDERVLIPRPETEELVDVALRELAARSVTAPLVIDLGCGSGAIGLALVTELAQRGVVATLIGVDKSGDALEVARRNAVKHAVHRASFVESDWFVSLDRSLRRHCDLIVANPPYVAATEWEELEPVVRHEPYGAIVAADGAAGPGMADIESIVTGAPTWLSPHGVVVVEHGEAQGESSRAVARGAGLLGARTERDMAGHDRFLVASRS